MHKALRRFYDRFPILGNIIIMLFVSLVLIAATLVFLDSWTRHGETSTVPEVKGLSLQQARITIEGSDLTAIIGDSIYDRSKAPGEVVDVWPSAGSVVKAGREVYLTIVTISPRSLSIDIPLTDISVKQATNYLNSRGINSVRLEYVDSEFDNMVVGARANGKQITLGSRILATSTVILEVGRTPQTPLDQAIDSAVDSILSAQ